MINPRFIRIFAAATFLGLALVASLLLGNSLYSPLEIWEALTESDSNSVAEIILQVRIPRTLTAAAIGMALAIAGWMLQATFSNPLADSALIGISPLAAIGLMVAFGIGSFEFGIIFSISILLLALIWLATLQISRDNFVLAAFAFGATATAFLATLTTSPLNQTGKSLTAWVFGSIATATNEQLLVIAIPIAIGLVLTTRSFPSLDVLALGDQTATNLGLDLIKARTRVFLAASLLIVPAVAIAGVISFVGLAVPLIIRRIQPGLHQAQFPLVLMTGAGLVLLADVISRMAFAPVEIPLGITLSAIGAPLMFWSVIRRTPNA